MEYNIVEWVESPFCEDYIMALGALDGRSYRDDMYPAYKRSVSRQAGRKLRVPHTKASKLWLNSRANSLVAEGVEADDLLGIWSTEMQGEGIIVTVDKDLDQVPGPHYNPRTETLYNLSKEESNDFFCKQMLTGDSIDNIPGIPGIGPVKASKIVEVSEEDQPTTIIRAYEDKFGDDWRDYFLSNGKMLFIQRAPDQHFSLKLFEELFA